jgi:hypothetical protein
MGVAVALSYVLIGDLPQRAFLEGCITPTHTAHSLNHQARAAIMPLTIGLDTVSVDRGDGKARAGTPI